MSTWNLASASSLLVPRVGLVRSCEVVSLGPAVCFGCSMSSPSSPVLVRRRLSVRSPIWPRWNKACRGVDAVIHLAWSEQLAWDRLVNLDVRGADVVFEAARRQNVPRVVLASSNHVVGAYPREYAPAPDHLAPMPDSYYGVAKATAEALGAFYHYRFGLDVDRRAHLVVLRDDPPICGCCRRGSHLTTPVAYSKHAFRHRSPATASCGEYRTTVGVGSRSTPHGHLATSRRTTPSASGPSYCSVTESRTYQKRTMRELAAPPSI